MVVLLYLKKNNKPNKELSAFPFFGLALHFYHKSFVLIIRPLDQQQLKKHKKGIDECTLNMELNHRIITLLANVVIQQYFLAHQAL